MLKYRAAGVAVIIFPYLRGIEGVKEGYERGKDEEIELFGLV